MLISSYYTYYNESITHDVYTASVVFSCTNLSSTINADAVLAVSFFTYL